MVIRQRARRPEQKLERREAILDAALGLFERRPFGAIAVTDVAAAVRLSKGALYLYFPTKEALFLALLDRELGRWAVRLAAQLQRMRPRPRAEHVAETMWQSFRGRESVLRLLAVLETILEQNVDYDTALAFKRRLADSLAAVGAALEGKLPWLGPGGGVHLLLRVNAVIVGLQQMADPAPVARQVQAVPGMEVFKVEFEKEFAIVLAALLRGLEPAAGHGGRGKGRR